MRNTVRNLIRDDNGSALIEFALLAPVFLMSLIGVMQVNLYMENYNAVRNVVNDTARYATVSYQTGNKVGNDAIEAQAGIIAKTAKYNLKEDKLTVTATAQSTRIDGVKEVNLQVRYAPENFLPFVSQRLTTVQYERQLFLFDSNAAVTAP
ncbi:MAG: TadE/TadG family type IV pilus assembly protein [Caenibius sp.]